MDEKKEFHFDFGVYYITEAQAEELFNNITVLVAAIGANIGGGYRDYAKTEKAAEDE